VPELGALRQKLSDFVDKTIWGGRRDYKDVLEKAAEAAYGPCLKKLWEGGGQPTREAYRKCVEEADLKKKYKDFWGKGGEAGGE